MLKHRRLGLVFGCFAACATCLPLSTARAESSCEKWQRGFDRFVIRLGTKVERTAERWFGDRPPLTPEESKQDRREIRLAVQEAMPEQAAAANARYGITVHDLTGAERMTAQTKLPAHVALLLHGLDDAGGQWEQLIPALRAAGFTSCEVNYPNDQAIADSTAVLMNHLAMLRSCGVNEVSLITHSMGALVARDALTAPTYYHSDARGSATLPHICRLIMIAPPNHGSNCAKFDCLSELREQAGRWFNDRTVDYGGIFDGMGEARIDIQPDSNFLKALDARPLPTHVAMTIIAGRVSAHTDARVDRTNEWFREHLPKAADVADALGSEVKTMVRDLGDGVVPIRSARLTGVDDFVLVKATHCDIVANMSSSSKRVPPAVPIVLERLREVRDVNVAAE